ncbi:hypothetical protein QBC47DRAFT_426859 [Echria macrotheca]|uniref:Uncharacterized protein n=1 Tax=Echria macrotheca TaxID=438768 RepID=A0AAJ0BL95_9PEZI|nr:hypothetical protein QBC47DRAFT_426859 [Echria macrotheca]
MRLSGFAPYAAIITPTAAQGENILINSTLPYPYTRGYISLTSDVPSAKPTAVATFYLTNACGAGTSFASATTINLPIDCLGASTLSTTISAGRCPLGIVQPPAIVDTVTSTPRTHFGFTCAPATPTATPTSYQLADVTHTFPVPTLRPDQTPPEKPVGLEVIHHADGTCYVSLGLEQVDPAYSYRRERIYTECLNQRTRPTVYAGTTTSTIPGCDECASGDEYNFGGSDDHEMGL